MQIDFLRNRIAMLHAIKVTLVSVGLVLLFTCSLSVGNEENDTGAKGDLMTVTPIEQVLMIHSRDLMSIPGVVGTGQGLHEGKPCIKVFVVKKTAGLEKKIPGTLEGYLVIIEETGEVKALPNDEPYR
jgi:hypothetical protein